MKPKGNSVIGTGQRINQAHTMLEGNERVKHKREIEGAVYTPFLLSQGPDVGVLKFLNHRLIKSQQSDTWAWLRRSD